MRSQLELATRARYEVLGELGAGGMATVFLARDLSLPRTVAVKVLSPALANDEETVTRFRREAKVAAALDHPGIVAVYDVGEDPSLAYFVMQHIDGVTLASLLATRGPQSVSAVTAVVGAVGRALHHAHGRGIIHRDVKPANLMRENSGRVFVTDFGIAKREELIGLTASGAVFGTPAYMSPEQYNGLAASAASDQYSLGVVAFELLTGRLPFVGGSVAEVMAGHLYDLPPDVRSLRADVPSRMALAIARMLAKEPGDRFRDAREAVAAVDGRERTGAQVVVPSQLVPSPQAEGATDDLTLRIPPQQGRATEPDAPTVLIRARPRWGMMLTMLVLGVLLLWVTLGFFR